MECNWKGLQFDNTQPLWNVQKNHKEQEIIWQFRLYKHICWTKMLSMGAEGMPCKIIWAEILTQSNSKTLEIENIFHLAAFAQSLLNNSTPLGRVF